MKRKDSPKNETTLRTVLDNTFHESHLEAAAVHIFGDDALKTIFASDHLTKDMTPNSILQNTNTWVHQVLDNIEPPVCSFEEDSRPGRLGNPLVRFNSTAQVGVLIMTPDRLHVQAHSNFSTIKANVCCFSGKWQYELQLESKGVMQLGWAMGDGQFSAETGVGDTIFSYSYDGNRVRKWNLSTDEYGEAWQVGDVIGCTIDLDMATINFYRNGKDLGEAFSSIPLGPGCVYYAAISLAFEERVQANFGGLPFKYPIETYLPLQQPPVGAFLRVNQLLYWMSRITSTPALEKSIVPVGKELSFEAGNFLFAEILMRHLSHVLLKPYIIDACIVPFLHDCTSSSVDKSSTLSIKHLEKLNFFCDVLALLLEPDDLQELVIAICKCLCQQFNQTSLSLDYTKQKQSLDILANICQHCSMRKTLLKQTFLVKTRIPQFMEVKPIDIIALKQCVPETWCRSAQVHKENQKENAARKEKYLQSCEIIKNKAEELERAQERALMILMNNTDGTPTEPSSRKIFLHMFRIFLKDNHTSSLVSFFMNQSQEMTPLPIALSYFHRLIKVLIALWERECPGEPVHVPLCLFYNGSVDYFGMDRLGGVLSHLIHSLHQALAIDLGEDHRIFHEPPRETSLPPTVTMRLSGVDAETGVVSTLTRWVTLGVAPPPADPPPVESVHPSPVTSLISLTEILDGVVLLYTLAAHKQLYKVSTLRDDLDKYVEALNEAKSRLTLARKTCPESAAQIELSIQAFERKISELSQVVMVWVQAAVYTPEKRANLVWLLRAVLFTLEAASNQADLFAFVPDFYIEALVQMCTALRNYFNPTVPLEELSGYKNLFIQVAEFLVKHFGDPRIVNLSSKDTVIEALAGFISKKTTLECLENISVESQEKLVLLLLKPYINRPWGQSNWILMRMWQGCGFAFRYQRSPHFSHKLGPRTPTSESSLLIHQSFEPCPSFHYQRLVARCLSQDQEMAAELLNSVLKQLNWSFSEFISMLQEIQNLSKRPERVIIDARQLKICATCFDFVVSLLRVLEMMCAVYLPVFTDPMREGTENLLERLCQLLSQILLRVTSPTGCFAHVIALEVPDLDSIDQFPVLAAVVGVLTALLAEDINKTDGTVMSAGAKSLLAEPAFNIDTLKYVLGEPEVTTGKQDVFSFKNYPEAVSAEEIGTVNKLITTLSRYQLKKAASKEEDEEELCPICCAMPLAVTFNPCHHQSCKSCITHHLMDCKECFFCKTIISSVVGVDGKLLYDSESKASAHKVAEASHSTPL